MTPELSKALNELAIVLISGITSILIPWAFKIARAYAEAKIASVNNADARSTLTFALERLDATAKTVVDQLNQRVVVRGEDGKILPGMKDKILSAAHKAVMERIPADVRATLEVYYAEKLRSVVLGKIESKVSDAKALNARCNPTPVVEGLGPSGGGSVLARG
jgi:hypothetical protein